MTCKDCIHYEVCKKCSFCDLTEYVEDLKKVCEWFEDKSKYRELPFIAMIEQHLVKGEFVNNNLQNWNGKYAVVYTDKNKSDAPLIDICGKFPYDADEAQERLKELNENA